MAGELDRQSWSEDSIDAPASDAGARSIDAPASDAGARSIDAPASGAGARSDVRALRPSLVSEIFIASRFDEFRQLREQLVALIQRHHSRWLRLVAVDLNDGLAANRPPLSESLRCVRRADFMILLLGETYGEPVRGRDKSFVHLEYEAALQDSAGTYVLAYGIGPSYRGKTLRHASDPGLRALQDAVDERHTIGLLDDTHSPRELAEQIFHNLLQALVDKHVGDMGERLRYETARELSAELLGPIDDDDLGEESEVSSLEEREAAGRGLALVDEHDQFEQPLDALLRPAEVAAIEQRREAEAAIALLEYGTAVVHLKRALRHRPLDLKSNYWLAQLYVGSGRKDLVERARELAERAAKLAERDGSRIRRAACLLLAARAARRAGDRDASLSLSEAAVAAADYYARARMERARARVAVDDDRGAVEDIRWVVRRYPRALAGAYGDPELAPIRRDIHRLSEGQRRRVLEAVRDWLAFEEKLEPVEPPPTPPTGDESLVRLGTIGRDAIGRCYARLCQLIATARDATDGLGTGDGSKGPVASRYRELGGQLVRDRAQIERLETTRARTQALLATAERGLRDARSKLFAGALAGVALTVASVLTIEHLGVRVAAIGAVVALMALVGVKLVPRLRAARASARTANAELARNADSLFECTGRVQAATREQSELAERTERAQAEVRWALGEFQHLLRGPVAGPFASIHAARPGSLVKVWPGRIDEAARELGRWIELVPDLPAWLEPGGDDGNPKLLRAVRSSRDGLRLEEMAAYT